MISALNLLILVDCLKISHPSDEKILENLKQYVVSPGVMRSNLILVENEETKKAFETILTNIVKIDKNVKVMSPMAMDDGTENNIKKILFYVGIADYYANGELIFSKISEKLNVFADRKSKVYVVWVKSSAFEEKFLTDFSQCKADKEALETFFYKENMGQIVEEDAALDMLKDTDGYYGSAGYPLNQCAQRKIPAMIADWNL